MKSSPPDLNEAADAVAANWATRLDAGPLTPAEDHALTAWLDEDARNHSRLEGYRQVYVQLGRTVPDLVDAGRMADPLKDSVVHPDFTGFRRLAAGLAVAAALALATFWWTGRPQVLSTTIANRQTVTLADGSQVDLNARTSLAVRLRGSERQVELAEGEAFFSVAKDPSRPFLITTPAGTVRVTGTQFNVRTVDSGQLEVTVLEGSVEVVPGADPTVRYLHPNDQLSVTGDRIATHKLGDGATRDVTAWREGRMVFESERLDLAVARFARYHGREIDVDPSVAALELGGRFKLDELDKFLGDIATVLPVQVLHADATHLRVVPRP